MNKGMMRLVLVFALLTVSLPLTAAASSSGPDKRLPGPPIPPPSSPSPSISSGVPSPVEDSPGWPRLSPRHPDTPGDVIEVFANTWMTNTVGLVYDHSRDHVRYAHNVDDRPSLYDIDYPPPHTLLEPLQLSTLNPGWPSSLDGRAGIGYDAVLDLYYAPDYNGDQAIADDNIIQFAPDGTILDAWEMDDDLGDNDAYDGSTIEGIIDIAIVPGDPTRYFATAAFDGSVVYEIDLIADGSWWTPDSWGTLLTFTVPHVEDNWGIDYDEASGLLWHSDVSSNHVVATDLSGNLVYEFDCGTVNTGITYVEDCGTGVPEIWVTEFATNMTTRCEVVGHCMGCVWEEMLREDMETWPPEGWAVVDYGGDCVWESNVTTGRPNYAGGDGNAADADADACGSGTSMETGLQSPPLDLENALSATLSYVAAYSHTLDDVAAVNVSADGGNTWTRLLTWTEEHDPYGPGEPVALDLTPHVGSPDSHVEFYYNAPQQAGWYEVDQVVISACLPYVSPELHLSPSNLTVKGCPGVVQTHTLSIINLLGYDDQFQIEYAVLTGTAVITGTTTLSITNEEQVSFDVQLTPEACLPEGTTVVATVTAWDSSHTFWDTTTITKTVTLNYWRSVAGEVDGGRMDNVVATYDGLVWSITGYGANAHVRAYDPESDTWATVGSSPPFDLNYARSGCHPYGSDVANKVLIYGDSTTEGFAGLWSYDMDADVWTQEMPDGTPPPYDGIWAPAWTYDPEEQLCYLTGGATEPGNGDLTTVFVYDPVNDRWLDPLPEFDTARAFHAAWIYDEGDARLLCVAGGLGQAVLDSTQCYNLDTGSWSGENADMGPLPQARWGMGYADKWHNIHHHQLWLTGGVLPSGLTNKTRYYDVTTGTWVNGGRLPAGATYRLGATTLDNEVYSLGGASGAFDFQGWANHHVQCWPCGVFGFLEGSLYDLQTGGAPCTEGTVHIEPGNVYVPVDPATGHYWTELITGTYEAEASAPGYSLDGPYPVTITTDMTSTQSFSLTRASVDITPTGFVSVVVTMGDPVTYMMTISNGGDLPLDFQFFEPEDYRWVSENPVSGTVPAGDERSAALTFQCWRSGWATGTLMLLNSDPCRSALTMPLAIQCVPAAGCVDIEAVTIEGPSVGFAGMPYTFTAIYTPADATLPIDYLWDDGGYGAYSVRTWDLTGTHILTLEAWNCATAYETDTLTIQILPMVRRLYLPISIREPGG